MSKGSVGCYMSSLLSKPIEDAWFVLKKDSQFGLSSDTIESMQRFYDKLPDEHKQKLEQIAQAIDQSSSDEKEIVMHMLSKTLQANEKSLPDLLQQGSLDHVFKPEQIDRGTFRVPDEMKKFIPLAPLAIGVIFAADGINQSQGAQARFIGNSLLHTGAAMGLNEPPKTSAFEYDDAASFQDPFIGVELGRAENPSFWQRIGSGAIGALQGLSLGALTGKPLRAGFTSRRSAAAGAKAEKVGEKIAQVPQGRTGIPGFFDRGKQRRLSSKQSRLQDKSDKLRAQASRQMSGALEGARRVGQITAGDPRAKDAFYSLLAGQMSGGGSPNIRGTASATPSGAGAGTGVGNVGNRQAGGAKYKEVFTGELEARRKEQGAGAYGTQQTNKGDKMKIGEQILKTVETRMNESNLVKGDCPKCGKDCANKMHCMSKAEKGKKPAKGVLVVIGTNAGPGAFKNGKRTKK